MSVTPSVFFFLVLFRRWHLSLDSRAFRRIENMASDSDGEEDFVTYGTPLEPLEEGRVVFLSFKHLSGSK